LDYGLRELAFEMLVESERHSALPDFDRGHFEDLIERVLEAGDLSLARRIRDHCGEDGWYRPHAIQFRFDLLENPERFAPLEHDCRKSVCGILDEETESDEPLIRLAYDCVSRYPALAMVFARAAIVSNPERHFDNEVLLDLIRDARVDLDLDPGSDPVESLFDWIENQTELKAKTKAENQEIKRLSDQLAAAREALSDKKRALRDQEHMLEEAGKQLEKALEPDLKATIQAQALEHSGDPNQEEAVQRLRLQVANLKAEIGEQQAQRRQLRRQLQEERQKLSTNATPVTQQEQASRDEEAERVGPSGRPILPDYTEAFRKTCATLSPTLVAKAILAAGRFAAQDPVIWQQTKTIQRLPEHYRIRINPDYRMIVHWLPGQSLFILDVIPRQDLESWIKRHR